MSKSDDDDPDYLGHRKRLRARFLQAPAALPDYELLEMLLAFVIPRQDTKPKAKKLLAEFGTLGDLSSADVQRLTDYGLSETTVAMLKAVHAGSLRLARAELRNRDALSSWDAVIGYCTAAMAYSPIEEFRILYLDRKNGLIADEAQQRGTVDHTPVYPREVVKRALELSASALILVHNHPSGDPQPSQADIDMTLQVQDACAKLGLVLHDHVVIGRGRNASFRSLGLL